MHPMRTQDVVIEKLELFFADVGLTVRLVLNGHKKSNYGVLSHEWHSTEVFSAVHSTGELQN